MLPDAQCPGGVRRYVCLYDVEERLLLRRFQVSANRSLDGVLDQLNSKSLTDAGPVALIDDPPTDDDDALLPASAAGAVQAALQPHAPLREPCGRPLCMWSLLGSAYQTLRATAAAFARWPL